MTSTTTKQIEEGYTIAKERYTALGVDPEAAMNTLKTIPISLHCWQGDLDVVKQYEKDVLSKRT